MAEDIEPLSIAILTGGTSRRFPGDKLKLTHLGQTIPEMMVARFAPVTDDLFLQGNGVVEGIRTNPDLAEDTGPINGLLSALISAKYDRLLLLGGDMPFLTPTILPVYPVVEMAVPQQPDGTWEPLAAVYSRQFVEPLRAFRADGGDSFRELFAFYPPTKVPVADFPDPLTFRSINTLEAWELAFGRAPDQLLGKATVLKPQGAGAQKILEMLDRPEKS